MSADVLQGWGWVLDGEQEIGRVTYTLVAGDLFQTYGVLVMDDMGKLPSKTLRLQLEDGRSVWFAVTDDSAGAGVYRIQIVG
jgi:hypothetical protein